MKLNPKIYFTFKKYIPIAEINTILLTTPNNSEPRLFLITGTKRAAAGWVNQLTNLHTGKRVTKPKEQDSTWLLEGKHYKLVENRKLKIKILNELKNLVHLHKGKNLFNTN